MKVKDNNKFYTIFKTLSLSEKKEFCEFLRLSFIKKPRLSDFIIEKIETGENLYLYLDNKYSERSLWNIYSELTRSLNQFLSLKEIMSDEKEMHNIKRKQFRKRNIRSLFISELRNDIKELKSREFSYSILKDIHHAAYSSLPELIKSGISNEFSEINKLSSDFLILSSLFEIYSNSIEDIIRKEFYGEKSELLNQNIFKFIEIEQLIKLINEKYPEYVDFFYIIFNLNLAIREPLNFLAYMNAKERFFLIAHKCSREYRSEIYVLLVNICNIISNRTKRNMDAQIFEIFKSKIDNGLTDDLKNVKIGENHFRDYIYIALRENDVEWAEEFLHKYSPLLAPSIKENNINTALAFINYHKKNYSLAIDHILKLNRRFYIHDLDFYTIQIFSYFDAGNIVDCLRLKIRFQEYANTNSKLPELYKSGVTNFLKILTGMISYIESGKKDILNDLEYAIENSTGLLWKSWILAKIKEIRH